MTTRSPQVSRIGEGVYRVEIDGRAEIVHMAGPPGERWAWARGRVFREAAPTETRKPRATGPRAIHAPMPARIVSLNVKPGARVTAGETLVVIEAMKMEWPLKAETAGTVTAVHGTPGQLVQADAVLVELG
jgi:biotin carboxyl carrier protein